MKGPQTVPGGKHVTQDIVCICGEGEERGRKAHGLCCCELTEGFLKHTTTGLQWVSWKPFFSQSDTPKWPWNNFQIQLISVVLRRFLISIQISDQGGKIFSFSPEMPNLLTLLHNPVVYNCVRPQSQLPWDTYDLAGCRLLVGRVCRPLKTREVFSCYVLP